MGCHWGTVRKNRPPLPTKFRVFPAAAAPRKGHSPFKIDILTRRFCSTSLHARFFSTNGEYQIGGETRRTTHYPRASHWQGARATGVLAKAGRSRARE